MEVYENNSLRMFCDYNRSLPMIKRVVNVLKTPKQENV